MGDTTTRSLNGSVDSRRDEMLLKMYDQMFNDIDRHILVVWQSVGVVVGAFALFALAEKDVINIDVAMSLILLLCAWLFAHLEDASLWYNRNLVIIANIERQFLRQTDLHDIHYYFGRHRPDKMISHLRIQWALGVGLGGVLLLFHFSKRIWPGLVASSSTFEVQRALPYLVVLISVGFIRYIRADRSAAYAQMLKNSPGIAIDTAGIDYGSGHGYPNK